MNGLQNLVLDDGYRFGLGAFETILVTKGKGILLSYHMERLKKALDILQIPLSVSFQDEIKRHVQQMPEHDDVLRVSVSQNNMVWETRRSVYHEEQYARGFHLMYSSVRRNETSLLTRIKSLNQGDNILQRRLALRSGFDEAIFLNSKGELTEGTSTNLFFVIDGRLFTPAATCGLLEGTVRRWLIEEYGAQEIHICPHELASVQEMFITNALMGIMPVRQLDKVVFPKRLVTRDLMDHYEKALVE